MYNLVFIDGCNSPRRLFFEGFQNDGQILATHKEISSMKFATWEEAKDFALLHKLSVVANQIS